MLLRRRRDAGWNRRRAAARLHQRRRTAHDRGFDLILQARGATVPILRGVERGVENGQHIAPAELRMPARGKRLSADPAQGRVVAERAAQILVLGETLDRKTASCRARSSPPSPGRPALRRRGLRNGLEKALGLVAQTLLRQRRAGEQKADKRQHRTQAQFHSIPPSRKKLCNHNTSTTLQAPCALTRGGIGEKRSATAIVRAALRLARETAKETGAEP